jgi:hypothetical protein
MCKLDDESHRRDDAGSGRCRSLPLEAMLGRAPLGRGTMPEQATPLTGDYNHDQLKLPSLKALGFVAGQQNLRRFFDLVAPQNYQNGPNP